MMNVHRPTSHHPQFANTRVPYKQNSFHEFQSNRIVVPTPRKIQNVPSPVPKRKTTQESVLFGEAGQELQTILFQGILDQEGQKEVVVANNVNPPTQPMEVEGEEEAELRSNIMELMNLRASSETKVPRLVAPPSPPLRSCNPITMNSPFGHATTLGEGAGAKEALPQLRIVTSRLHQKAEGKAKRESKEFIRYRSASWPALSKLVTSE